MPYTVKKPPTWLKNLPTGAISIGVKTFNRVLAETGDEEQARKAAWRNIKLKYKKVGDKWVRRTSKDEFYQDSEYDYLAIEEILAVFPRLKDYPHQAREDFLEYLRWELRHRPDGEEEEAVAEAWQQLYKSYPKRDVKIHFQSAQIMAPFTEADGIIKIPTIFTREGVMNKGYKPWEDSGEGKRGLKHSASSFEGKPVIYWHPPERRPADQNDQVIGWCSDVQAREEDRVIQGTTNIKVEDSPPQFIENIRHGEDREGSIGYFEDTEYIQGKFDGIPYERVEWNVRCDHYAIGIPRGACGVDDGCGLGFDEQEDGIELDETINLDEMEGEGIVSLSRLKEFFLDTFRRNYKKASEDVTWDLRRTDYTPSQLKRSSAVVTGDGTKRSDYHLLHHRPDGTLIWYGVDANGKALMEDGVQLSSADKAKAKRHLTRHYGEFGKTPPWKKTKGSKDMDIKLNEEEKTAYENKIGELTTEKLALETEKSTLLKEKTDLETEKTAWETEKTTLTEERDDLKTWKEESEPKLTGYVEAEKTVIEKQRDELIDKIAKATGEEDAEAVKEKYKDWDVEQLTHFEATIVKSTDRSALARPTTIGPDGKPIEVEKTSLEVRGKELTVGSLFEKKVGED